ncbi:hypothetical protein Fcan01_24056 [Folsomia candida]|uniref:Uncharacterized protein n=1 Tax=Folsomia candida TaxID=158441 RepID=A0A226D7V3_FOLCA|nr:hypothetical protein Fcan01_24056 [Folsomia candida]
MKYYILISALLAAGHSSSLGAKQSCSGWAYTSSNSNLVNPFEFGTDASNEKAYGCRVQNGNEIVPGHYSFSTRACRIAVAGREIVATAGVFVLDNAGSANLHFQPSEGLPQWGEAIQGGSTANGEPLYAIRCLATVDGRAAWLAGRYQDSTRAAVGAWGGLEVPCNAGSVQFLVCD